MSIELGNSKSTINNFEIYDNPMNIPYNGSNASNAIVNSNAQKFISHCQFIFDLFNNETSTNDIVNSGNTNIDHQEDKNQNAIVNLKRTEYKHIKHMEKNNRNNHTELDKHINQPSKLNSKLKETVLFYIQRNIDNDIIVYTIKYLIQRKVINNKEVNIFVPIENSNKNTCINMYKCNKNKIEKLYVSLSSYTNSQQQLYFNDFFISNNTKIFQCTLIPPNKNKTKHWTLYSEILPYLITLYPKKNGQILTKTCYLQPDNRLQEFTFIVVAVIILNGRLQQFELFGTTNTTISKYIFQISTELKLKYDCAMLLKKNN